MLHPVPAHTRAPVQTQRSCVVPFAAMRCRGELVDFRSCST